jgi:hypothetical protein
LLITGDPVMNEFGSLSTCVLHSLAPVVVATAKTWAPAAVAASMPPSPATISPFQ